MHIISQDLYAFYHLAFIDRTLMESPGTSRLPSILLSALALSKQSLFWVISPAFSGRLYSSPESLSAGTLILMVVLSIGRHCVHCLYTCYQIGLIQTTPALTAAETTDGQENLRFFDIILLFMKSHLSTLESDRNSLHYHFVGFFSPMTVFYS